MRRFVEMSFCNTAFGKKTRMCLQNAMEVRRPAGGGAKLWIEITRLLQRRRLEEVSRFTADKLLEGILVWRSAEQSQ